MKKKIKLNFNKTFYKKKVSIVVCFSKNTKIFHEVYRSMIRKNIFTKCSRNYFSKNEMRKNTSKFSINLKVQNCLIFMIYASIQPIYTRTHVIFIRLRCQCDIL